MTQYNPGDEIMFLLNEGSETNPYVRTIKVQIIGFGNGDNPHQLLCYVPHYVSVHSSFKLGRNHQNWYGFDGKFIGEYGMFIEEADVIKHFPRLEGETCVNCQTFIQWAQAGFDEEFWCHSCKQNPYR